MLIPQFSIRSLLIVTTISAVFFSIVGMAVRGSTWAMGVSAGVVSLAVLAGVLFPGLALLSIGLVAELNVASRPTEGLYEVIEQIGWCDRRGETTL